jgi:hypothetical protein
MRARGYREIALYVEWPPTSEEKGEHAWARAPDVLGDNDELVELPAIFGDLVLRRGHVVNAMGNAGAHTAEEISPVILSVEEDENSSGE